MLLLHTCTVLRSGDKGISTCKSFLCAFSSIHLKLLLFHRVDLQVQMVWIWGLKWISWDTFHAKPYKTASYVVRGIMLSTCSINSKYRGTFPNKNHCWSQTKILFLLETMLLTKGLLNKNSNKEYKEFQEQTHAKCSFIHIVAVRGITGLSQWLSWCEMPQPAMTTPLPQKVIKFVFNAKEIIHWLFSKNSYSFPVFKNNWKEKLFDQSKLKSVSSLGFTVFPVLCCLT